MIVAKLNGGLGNQMFQYAAGKALTIKLNTDLKVDVSFFNIKLENKWTQRYYELDVFSGIKNIISDEDIKPFLDVKNSNWFIRGFRNLGKYKYFYEPEFCYTEKFFKQKNNTYVEGYWQSEKYFKSIESIIHNEFVFKDYSSITNKELANHISGVNSVSIHVRRTDYVNEIGLQQHGLCNVEYYQKAVKFLSEKVHEINLFVFSDDTEWTKHNLSFNFPVTFIDYNKGKESYEDMRLMSLCKHNIIANSSFSWWAAWLNHNSEKIVIAPTKWFNNKEKNTKDLIPAEWLKM